MAGVVRLAAMILGLCVAGCAAGCARGRGAVTPTQAGLQANNIVDIGSQLEVQQAFPIGDITAFAQKSLREHRTACLNRGRPRSILCLSGGGSFGAYSAGVLCGWTARGDRPTFDVVTGVSTGGLIAPLAFLGPAYDRELQRLYTTVSDKDIYVLRPVRGVFSEALADNTPLARQIDRIVTDAMIRDIAIEHTKGRRLYLGTTESQGKKFVAWDIGEIACRGTPQDRELIKRIMLGSSAIPGFFPPSEIPVTVEGQPFVEKHVDGGVSFSLFIRPPTTTPEEDRLPPAERFAGVNVYALVAGKLWADPEVIRPWVLSVAAANISTLSYAQTRGDITRLWAVCLISGMNFHLAAIPETTPTPKTSTDFNPTTMKPLFDAAARQTLDGGVWRSSPPGAAPGEDPLVRGRTDLIVVPRSAAVPASR